MLKRLPLSLAVALLLVGGFLVVVLHLFSLRFDAGDIYPPYSSLRSDPLGSRAFYESLDSLNEVSARRWLEPGAKMPATSLQDPSTFFLLGLPHRAASHLSKADVEVIEDYLSKGGHVIISFRPISGTGWYDRTRDEIEEERAKKAEKEGRRRPAQQKEEPSEEQKENEEPTRRKKLRLKKEEEKMIVSLTQRWGFKFKEGTLPLNEDAQPSFVRAEAKELPLPELPENLPWHSSLQFHELSPEWKAVYKWENEAVLMTRSWKKGRLTLSADSYLFSNEGLKNHRQPAFLAWLAAGSRTIYFDESHLGVRQEPGVASLIRKYRLHGVAFALALLAGLFVWRNTLSLVPPEEEPAAAITKVAGRTAGAGFLNLLYRSVKPPDLVPTAFSEWLRTIRAAQGSRQDKIKEMKLLAVAGNKTHPVELYRSLVKIWKRKT